MKVIGQTILEVIILGVIGVSLSFGVNTVRDSRAVNPTRDYFRIGDRPAPANPPTAHAGTPPDATFPAASGASPETASDVAPDGEPQATDDPDGEVPEHPYQVVSTEDVVKLFHDPHTVMGATVFVDARSHELYKEGHIPGAVHADHYHLEEYVDELLLAAEGAERVITYCEGGDCEDSIFLCADLVELGVPYDMIYFYPGGWKGWLATDLPIVTGPNRR